MQSETEILSAAEFLTASAGVAGVAVAGRASADTLADVPPRETGAPLSGHSERSKYVHIRRIPEAGPGERHVDPADAINSKTPLDKLVGAITPSDLHYERSHAGAPELDPAKHRLLLHGMTQKQLVFTLNDLKAMPSISRIAFIECTGNGWENWKERGREPDRAEYPWPGQHERMDRSAIKVPHRTGRQGLRGSHGCLPRVAMPPALRVAFHSRTRSWTRLSSPTARMASRSGLLTAFPIRLIMPGFEGNLNIKWLRRLKFGDQPWMTRWETARYTQLLADGKASQFQLRMETNSVITSPSGTMAIKPGYNRITGLAWSGHGKIEKVEISTDGAKSWQQAQLNPSASKSADPISDDLDLGRPKHKDRKSFYRR